MRRPAPVATLKAMNGVLHRAPRIPRRFGLTWRRDLAVPFAVGVAQLAGTALHVGAQFRYQWRRSAAAKVDPGHLGLALNSAHPTALYWALMIVGPVALVARRRHPVTVAWIALAAAVTPSSFLYTTNSIQSPNWFGYLSVIVAFFVAAASGHRRAAWTVLVAGYVCALWLGPLAWNRQAAPPAAALFVGTWLVVLVVAAEAARMRQERRAEATAARELEARHRASAEHLRMARELHDVIGHNISLINVQAGVGLDLMDTQPEQARAALAAVKTVSGQALGELRAMLSALRDANEDAPRSPAPGLARLPELISLTGPAGLAVTTDVTGSPRALPAAVDLAAYRIVQESLTNVARHAGPTTVAVLVAYGEHDLRLEITDDGCGAGARGTPNGGGPNGGAPAASLPGHGAGGTGIPGMRERALALGGQLEAGPRPDQGFQVSARLPIDGGP
jgi:signal transduction histidine kinase